MTVPATAQRWAQYERGPYIRMHSGEKFFLKDPRPEEFRIPDIAYHLARVNRYTGGSEISVAQHSAVGAMMAARFYPTERLLPARLVIHDVTEHAIGDVSSPLKRLIPEYKQLELVHEAAAERRFDLTYVGDPLVKEVDDRMWLTERRMVFRDAEEAGVDMSEDVRWCPHSPFDINDDELIELFSPWGPYEAEHVWLQQLYAWLPWVK